jgi:hypothetical protein
MDQRVMMSSEMKNAIMAGSVQQVKRLLDTGENVLGVLVYAVIFKFSILQFAVFERHHAIVHMLLKRGFNDIVVLGCSKKTPLHQASSNNDVVMVELLLEYGANIEAHDDNMMTPLHTAVLWGHCQVVRVLLDNGANLKARTCWKPDDMSIICRSATPMQIACSERGPRHAIVRDMLQRHQEDMEHAVMMGQHPRLGFSSQLSRLDPELLRLIVESARM